MAEKLEKFNYKHAEISFEMIGHLAAIFDIVGIAEFIKSTKNKELYFDISESQKMNTPKLKKLASTIEELYHELND